MIGMLLLLVGCGGGGGGDSLAAPSPSDDKASSARSPHLIYLHGAIIEDQGPRPTHPRFGIYEYQQILDTFTAAGFQVSGEQRPPRTQPQEYASRTAAQVRALLDSGVLPNEIIVVGFSKGGGLAVLTALELDNPEISYVFIACCVPFLEGAVESSGGQIQGRMLSILESSDDLGSCNALFDLASPVSETAEIELHLGGGHGAFYRPQPEWVDPVVRWAFDGSRRTTGITPGSLFTHEEDAAPSTGGGLSRGVAWGDLDTDGYPDLVVANAIGQEQMLYRNDGSGGFFRLRDNPASVSKGDTEGAFWADYDNDGDLDLLLTNQFDQPSRLFRNDANSGLAPVAAGDLGDERPLSANSACWGDVDNDGHLDVFVVQREGLDDLLFRNLGDGRFRRITEGDAVTNGGDGRTCSMGDIDGDGDLDLFVGNFVLDGAKAPNFLYLNRGDGAFETVSEGEIVTDLQATYGSSFADIDDDGDLDLFLSNIAGSDHNALYLNDGRGHFTKRTGGELVTAAGRPSKGHAFGDYDLDGDLDLVIANGTEAEVDLRNFLYLNDGAGRFAAVIDGDLVDTPNISAGTAWADADLDGDLDLVVANWGGNDEDNAFYRNNTTGKGWLVLRLIGTDSNRMGWGARVRLTATIDGATRTQNRWMNPTTGYASQNQPIVHFGLGDADRVESIEIAWPSGNTDRIGPTPVNQILTVTEGGRR